MLSTINSRFRQKHFERVTTNSPARWPSSRSCSASDERGLLNLTDVGFSRLLVARSGGRRSSHFVTVLSATMLQVWVFSFRLASHYWLCLSPNEIGGDGFETRRHETSGQDLSSYHHIFVYYGSCHTQLSHHRII